MIYLIVESKPHLSFGTENGSLFKIVSKNIVFFSIFLHQYYHS